MQIEDEAGALGVAGVKIEVALHLQGHLLTNGQSETVTLGKVTHLEERLEEVVALLLGNAAASV